MCHLDLDSDFMLPSFDLQVSQTHRANMNVSRRIAASRILDSIRHHPVHRAAFSTHTRLRQSKPSTVQTPIQSQPVETAAPTPGHPAPEAKVVETPVQSIRPDNVQALPGGKPRETNDLPLAMFFGGLFAIPFVVYYYWQYRQDHMDKKKERLLQEQREKYRLGG